MDSKTRFAQSPELESGELVEREMQVRETSEGGRLSEQLLVQVIGHPVGPRRGEEPQRRSVERRAECRQRDQVASGELGTVEHPGVADARRHRIDEPLGGKSLQLDLVLGGTQREHLVEVGHPFICAVVPIPGPGAERTDVVVVALVDQPRPRRRPGQVVVVDHHRLSVGGQVDVELHPLDAGLDRRPERRQRVLGEVRGIATVCTNARSGPTHRGDGRGAGDSSGVDGLRPIRGGTSSPARHRVRGCPASWRRWWQSRHRAGCGRFGSTGDSAGPVRSGSSSMWVPAVGDHGVTRSSMGIGRPRPLRRTMSRYRFGCPPGGASMVAHRTSRCRVVGCQRRRAPRLWSKGSSRRREKVTSSGVMASPRAENRRRGGFGARHRGPGPVER